MKLFITRRIFKSGWSLEHWEPAPGLRRIVIIELGRTRIEWHGRRWAF